MSARPGIGPAETRCRLATPDGVIEVEGQDRAAFPFDGPLALARRRGTPVPRSSAATPRFSAIPPEREERHPRDRATGASLLRPLEKAVAGAGLAARLHQTSSEPPARRGRLSRGRPTASASPRSVEPDGAAGSISAGAPAV
jgi:hypothetical protein